jgi:hypothetical protein
VPDVSQHWRVHDQVPERPDRSHVPAGSRRGSCGRGRGARPDRRGGNERPTWRTPMDRRLGPGYTTNDTPAGTGVLLHGGAAVVLQVHYNLIHHRTPIAPAPSSASSEPEDYAGIDIFRIDLPPAAQFPRARSPGSARAGLPGFGLGILRGRSSSCSSGHGPTRFRSRPPLSCVTASAGTPRRPRARLSRRCDH